MTVEIARGDNEGVLQRGLGGNLPKLPLGQGRSSRPPRRSPRRRATEKGRRCARARKDNMPPIRRNRCGCGSPGSPSWPVSIRVHAGIIEGRCSPRWVVAEVKSHGPSSGTVARPRSRTTSSPKQRICSIRAGHSGSCGSRRSAGLRMTSQRGSAPATAAKAGLETRRRWRCMVRGMIKGKPDPHIGRRDGESAICDYAILTSPHVSGQNHERVQGWSAPIAISDSSCWCCCRFSLLAFGFLTSPRSQRSMRPSHGPSTFTRSCCLFLAVHRSTPGDSIQGIRHPSKIRKALECPHALNRGLLRRDAMEGIREHLAGHVVHNGCRRAQ